MRTPETGTAEVWKEFRGRLRGYLVKRIPRNQDADDILQEIFLKVHRGLPKLKDSEKLEPWVYRITKNTLTDFYRTQRDSQDGVEDMPDPMPANDDSEAASAIAACLRPMAEDLPEADREALRLAEWEDRPQKEVAETLGLSLSGAKSKVQRARRKLKKKLLDCCRFEFDRRGKIIHYRRRGNKDNFNDCD